MEIVAHHEFRVTRNEDLEVEEDETENLHPGAREGAAAAPRFGPPIRLEISDDMDHVTLELLMAELEITEQEVYRLPAPLDLVGLFESTKLDRPPLKYPRNVPTTSVSLLPTEPTEKPDIFASIDRGDILLHHPYESFATSVQALLEQAAADPNVLAIKQTLYRTSGDSPIVEALIDAAEAGKAVLALVEIKARFDETGQHRLGAQAGEGRRSRGLRPGRPEDAQQARPGGAAGPQRQSSGTTATSAPATTTPRPAASMKTSAC